MNSARTALLLAGAAAASQAFVGLVCAEGEALKLGIEDTTLLAQVVPSLAISHQLNAQSIYLRGVGTMRIPATKAQ